MDSLQQLCVPLLSHNHFFLSILDKRDSFRTHVFFLTPPNQWVVAMHHFPDINHSIKEIRRVLEKDGFFILSDAKTYDIDKKGFIDEFQKYMEDGHNHFYYEDEIIELFKNQGFVKQNIFYSRIRYPRKYSERYQNLIDNESKEVIDKYKMEIAGDNIFMTVQIMNILFRKKKT